VAVLKVKEKKVVQYSLPVMARTLVAPYLVTRYAGENFVGAKGDTVNMKIDELKAVARDYEWRTRNAPIVLDDIGGGASMPVKLNKHIYSATALTDEHMKMDTVQLAGEVVTPQAKALAADYEAKVVAGWRTMSLADDLILGALDLSDLDPYLYLLEANRVLTARKVAPKQGRFAIVGSDVAAAFLASDRLSRYDSTGETGTPALRDAVIGKVANTVIIEHEGLNPKEGYLASTTALILANLAPEVPAGATTGATFSQGGFAMRWIADYDPNYLRDRSIVSSFLGLVDVRDERNADGSWIYEVGDMDEDDAPEGTVFNPVGTRKNVRAVKFQFTGTGSVLD
jgi:hypothetical protein